MNLPIEFVVNGIPVSQQSRARVQRWRDEVHLAVERTTKVSIPITSDATVSITYFIHFGSRNVPDVDNVAKPILDAIKGAVFTDDAQVSDMICRRRYLDPKLEIKGGSPLLVRARAINRPFVHIYVTEANTRELIL